MTDHLTPEQEAGGATLVSDQLGYEVSRYIFGRPAELRRRVQDDPQFRAAADLLRTSPTPAFFTASRLA